jgi:peptidoglycan/xylan/chitin deacetylase (PgdA/CDA1 family)
MMIPARLARILYKAAMGERYVVRAPGERRVLALTFDDGPDREHTPPILDLLARHGVKATFFLTGAQAESRSEVVARTVAEGHEIGNHSFMHRRFARMAVPEQMAEIQRADDLLRSHDGREWHWFRPPQGALPLGLFRELRARRHPVAMWSYDSRDYAREGVAPIVARFDARPARAGDVLLFHDDNADTCEALATLLPRWLGEGYAFETLSTMQPLRHG